MDQEDKKFEWQGEKDLVSGKSTVSRRHLIGGLGLAALSLLALPPLAHTSPVEAMSGPAGGAYVVQSDGADGGAELIQLLQNLPAGGVVIVPFGTQLVCSSTVVISSPVVLVGYGAALQAGHTQQNVLSIQSDDVFVYGLKVAGNPLQANENAVSVAAGKGRITLEHVTTAGCLIGVSSARRAHHLKLEGCVLNSSVHGAVLRLPEHSTVDGCTVNDHPGSGATGIRIQGEEKTVTAITTSSSSVTSAGHQLRAGDKIRFYAEGTVVLPDEIKLDTVYYAAGTIGADQFQLSAYPGGPPLTWTGQNLSGSGSCRHRSVQPGKKIVRASVLLQHGTALLQQGRIRPVRGSLPERNAQLG
ncbi:hypothetical protein ACFQI7_03370 [Paenibacillus allorhizosphaerae]|uniref:Right-handed parallel beta-helix repeat-containing protein n=1 Tax=Paenibacillus allorhizosphaerae TaxID=2849866 RepID=A0ABM8VCV4_9BACL|nr:hypothetical protein [Paenibacillus allorhizosphaerae]CAG7625296.1 hypothetical protein PAECIP111802_01154 [Paenibacillus allorhizosphaerae]